MSVEIYLDSCLYGFTRDRFSGAGCWIVIQGSCPELIGGENAGTYVPVIFGHFLTATAKEAGIVERYNFAPMPPPPPKEIRIKGPSIRPKKSSIFGGGLRLSLLG